MAFRIERDESAARGLRRLAQKELRSVRRELERTTPPGPATIYEARKRLKKARAIYDLIRADHGGGLSGSGRRLRSINRVLSRLRDRDVMVQMLERLRTRNPRLFSEHTYARLRRQFIAMKREATDEAERGGTWKKLARELRALRRDARQWRPAHRRFGSLAPGMRASYRRGRKAMTRALKDQRAADFHAWRKEIKALRYTLRLIEQSSPQIRRQLTALHRAETCLGEEHNLVVLCEELTAEGSACADAIDRDLLRLAADDYQCDLRNKAIAGARPLFARKPGAFVRAVKRAWKSWQRGRRAAPGRGRSQRAA